MVTYVACSIVEPFLPQVSGIFGAARIKKKDEKSLETDNNDEQELENDTEGISVFKPQNAKSPAYPKHYRKNKYAESLPHFLPSLRHIHVSVFATQYNGYDDYKHNHVHCICNSKRRNHSTIQW